ncbi:MAG: ferritin-like domain-containing protein [Acaryochloris sp. RU_4_1]|nr:ferritin-like domain-containing protein [Acaryochloris sp. SU_5_25]NJM65640.1 ferritin-like domain-containing protein [Acaryochloris sp. RU_4_1]NJR55913.1 ferritin-like domain-containing protein [Acaryochloris sp. CRU_2_0]
MTFMIKLGSKDHKQLFCRSFLDSYLDYEPETLPWPDLDPISLERLRGIPFWREALLTESEAGVMVSAFAQTLTDPLIQEAIALQGREEHRHARLLNHLIKRYDIQVSPLPDIAVPDQIETAFTDFGFGECLDSYFAFGMFELARQARYMPESIFKIFEPILDEEARHIVFFVNWVTYLHIQQGWTWEGPRGIRALWHYGKALRTLIQAFGGSGDSEGKPFTAAEAGHFMDDLTPMQFLTTCLEANHQRMQRFDPQLLQPLLMPRLSKVALTGLRLWPRRDPMPSAQRG